MTAWGTAVAVSRFGPKSAKEERDDGFHIVIIREIFDAYRLKKALAAQVR